MYAVGGFNGSLRVRTVDAYDPVKDEWCCVSSMQDRRSTLGSAFLNGLLYAVGGFDGSTGNILHYLAYCLCGDVHSCHVGYGNNARIMKILMKPGMRYMYCILTSVTIMMISICRFSYYRGI